MKSEVIQRGIEQKYSLGHAGLRAAGGIGDPIVSANFVAPEKELALPDPSGDAYLAGLPVATIRSGETVVCLRLVPGLIEYYESAGLIPDGARVVQIDPRISKLPNGEILYGFPNTNPLAQMDDGAFSQDGFVNKSPVLVPTYMGQNIRAEVARLGARSVEMPDSVITNNKELLRKNASRYGYNVVPGALASEWDDIKGVMDEFGGSPHGVWLKFPTGSGGDLVFRVKEVSEQALRGGRDTIRSSILRSFQNSDFGMKGEDFWPEGQFMPDGFGLVVESDVRNHGKLVVNGSNHIVTHRDGSFEILGNFQQIIGPDGDYRGSRPYYPNTSKVVEMIYEQTEAVARYNMNQNGYFGVQGLDYFVVNGGDQLKVYCTEVNSRPPVSSYPNIVASKYGVAEWINTNVQLPNNVVEIDDFIKSVGSDLVFGDPRSGKVVPLAFRTLVGKDSMVPSNKAKVMIMANQASTCDDIMSTLEGRGVKFA